MPNQTQLKNLHIILDRDGTIIKDKHYLSNPEDIELLPGVANALRLLSLAGATLYIVTNQSGIGRGYFEEKAYAACAEKVLELLAEERINIEHTTYCPHAPEQNCACRKPASGMWDEIKDKFQLSPEHAIMIGDKIDDIRFGINNNFVANILLLTGHGKNTAEKYGLPEPYSEDTIATCGICTPDYLVQTIYQPKTRPEADKPHAVAIDLAAAVAWIFQNFKQDT